MKKNRVMGVSRRDFLHTSMLAGAGAASFGGASPVAQSSQSHNSDGRTMFDEATIAGLQRAMAAGRTSAVELTNRHHIQASHK